jgi:hypothetical protein
VTNVPTEGVCALTVRQTSARVPERPSRSRRRALDVTKAASLAHLDRALDIFSQAMDDWGRTARFTILMVTITASLSVLIVFARSVIPIATIR